MTITAKKKDVVIVGLGWTGSILGMELAQEGLEVLALERGEDRDSVPDWAYPKPADELKYGVRFGYALRPRDATLTVRRTLSETALPYRQLGSFLPGNGVGGAGMHWNAMNWRALPAELRLRSYIEENFGSDIIPENMTIQDWGVDYDELEPFFDQFERIAGVSGRAGNIKGKIQEGGNPFEGWRANDYPMPPLPVTLNERLFEKAAKNMGYHPFPRPSAIASQSYTNPYGMQMGPCNFCGFCERYGCVNYSKDSPQTMILAALKRMPNFEYRVNSTVLRVEKSPDGKTATGVTYVNKKGEEVFQPADLVILAAFQLDNVQLMLLSGIGQPYNPESGEGVVGRNYAYQTNCGSTLFFKDQIFNPFVGNGSNGMSMDDFAVSQIDFRKEGFIGGSYISTTQTGGWPIQSISLPSGTPGWGADWKKAVKESYGHTMSISSHGSSMSYRDAYLDLDPTYKDQFGRSMMRMTFNWHDNDLLMSQFMKKRIDEMAATLNPDTYQSAAKKLGAMYDVRPYQTTHTVGGTVMGADPKTSVLNRFLQSWDAHNVWVMGSGAFPQNTQYNPTGTVGALAYWAAHALRTNYLRNPRPLV